VNATHIEPHILTLEEEIAALRDQLLTRDPAIDRAELQRRLGEYTARRKMDLGLFHRIDM
jgi:hypothetical protein